MNERRYQMVRPCGQCPFRTDDTAIRFANRERAEEIEESAYRHGFPCHTTAELVEQDDDPLSGQEGYQFGEDTQHCAGYILMSFKSGYDTWPGIDNDEDLAERLQNQIDWKAPVFDNAEDFFEANSKKTGTSETIPPRRSSSPTSAIQSRHCPDRPTKA